MTVRTAKARKLGQTKFDTRTRYQSQLQLKELIASEIFRIDSLYLRFKASMHCFKREMHFLTPSRVGRPAKSRHTEVVKAQHVRRRTPENQEFKTLVHVISYQGIVSVGGFRSRRTSTGAWDIRHDWQLLFCVYLPLMVR